MSATEKPSGVGFGNGSATSCSIIVLPLKIKIARPNAAEIDFLTVHFPERFAQFMGFESPAIQ